MNGAHHPDGGDWITKHPYRLSGFTTAVGVRDTYTHRQAVVTQHRKSGLNSHLQPCGAVCAPALCATTPFRFGVSHIFTTIFQQQRIFYYTQSAIKIHCEGTHSILHVYVETNLNLTEIASLPRVGGSRIGGWGEGG